VHIFREIIDKSIITKLFPDHFNRLFNLISSINTISIPPIGAYPIGSNLLRINDFLLSRPTSFKSLVRLTESLATVTAMLLVGIIAIAGMSCSSSRRKILPFASWYFPYALAV